jgi:hypothetical protein
MKKKYAAQTKNILAWEKKQRSTYLKQGLFNGVIAGAVAVGILYFLLVWIN